MFQNYDSLLSNESSRRQNHPLRNFTGKYQSSTILGNQDQPAYLTSRGGYDAQSPRNDLEYLRRPFRGYAGGGQRDRSYHSND